MALSKTKPTPAPATPEPAQTDAPTTSSTDTPTTTHTDTPTDSNTDTPTSSDGWDVDIAFASRVTRHRAVTVVDVPPVVVEKMLTAFHSEQWMIIPVKDEDDYRTRANVLYSGADKVAEKVGGPVSVIVVPGKYFANLNEFMKTELNEATHLRATVSQRRGAKTRRP